MQRKLITPLMACILLLTFASFCYAEAMTAALCKEKAQAAAALVKAEGEAAFDKIRDEKGPFRFGDGKGYVWIHNIDGVMIMHPIKPALEGANLMDKRDSNGMYFFVAMNEIAEDKGAGWVQYAWPKPGAKESSAKVSYVVLVGDYIIGSGMYDLTAADIKKQFPNDAIYEE